MRRRVPSREELLRRVDDVKARLAQRTPRPLDGQEALSEDLFHPDPTPHADGHQLAFDD